jgi:hypothetical protein
MAKNKKTEELDLQEQESQQEEQIVEQESQQEEKEAQPKLQKYKLKGLLVWGSIVYSGEPDSQFPMTDEIAEKLLAIRPELIQLFEVQ